MAQTPPPTGKKPLPTPKPRDEFSPVVSTVKPPVSAPYKGTSVVDYLVSQKKAPDYASRQVLASQLGIKNYSGTAQQNVQMLNILQNANPASKPAGNPYANIQPAPRVPIASVKRPSLDNIITQYARDEFSPVQAATRAPAGNPYANIQPAPRVPIASVRRSGSQFARDEFSPVQDVLQPIAKSDQIATSPLPIVKNYQRTSNPIFPLDFAGYDVVPLDNQIRSMRKNSVNLVSKDINPVLLNMQSKWKSPYKFVVSEGYRSSEDQGKIDPKYTSAAPGNSQHQSGYAVDINFLDENNNIMQNSDSRLSGLHAEFEKLGRQYGLMKPLAGDTPHYVSAQSFLNNSKETLTPEIYNYFNKKLYDGTLTNEDVNFLMQYVSQNASLIPYERN